MRVTMVKPLDFFSGLGVEVWGLGVGGWGLCDHSPGLGMVFEVEGLWLRVQGLKS